MADFTHNEKCAMIVALTQIGAIQDSRKEARTRIMLRFQDMLGIDMFDLMEYSNTKVKEMGPTLSSLSNDKKKQFVRMMLALILEDGKMVPAEQQALTTLLTAFQIPINLAKDIMEEVVGRKL